MARFGELTGHAPCGSRQPLPYLGWLGRGAKRAPEIPTTPMRLGLMVSLSARAIQTSPHTRTTRGPFPARFRQELASGARALRIKREPSASEGVESEGGD